MDKGYQMGGSMTINRPPVNTYRWLHSNGTVVSVPAISGPLPVSWDSVEGVREGGSVIKGMRTGLGRDMGSLVAASNIAPLSFTAEQDNTLRLNFQLPHRQPDSGFLLPVNLRAEEGVCLTVVMDLAAAGEEASAALAALQTRVLVRRDAVVRLVQIQRLCASDTLFNDIGVQCEENARFELVRLILGGQATYDGCAAALAGDASAFTAEIGYQLSGQNRLDMNYEAVHTGRRTESAIHASGVLRDRADKLFRGTIDLRKGCSGSVGNETEDVLLMDETVRNRTVPVILCGEEDVVGNHGATIGRLDEGLIFYLQSRGMEREDIYELCARARIDAVIRKIPDPDTIRYLFPHLTGETENAEEGRTAV